MRAKFNVRRVEKGDFEFIYNSLCELENEIFDKRELEKVFHENIANPNNLYLLAEGEFEKFGFITFHTQGLLHHSGRVGEIQEFYIVSHYRNQGMGRQLMEAVLNYANQNELKSIEVTTNRKRIENTAIYENLGFRLTHNKFTISR
jgi:PhnO protein